MSPFQEVKGFGQDTLEPVMFGPRLLGSLLLLQACLGTTAQFSGIGLVFRLPSHGVVLREGSRLTAHGFFFRFLASGFVDCLATCFSRVAC